MRAVRRWRPYPVDETCKLYLPFYKYGSEQSKIWDISGNNNHGTIAGAVPAIYPMLQPVVASGSVTLANWRCSAVNSTALVDFLAASVLTDYLNHLLVIKDSSGRVIQGYIKAAGTGETFGDELLTAWSNTNYDTFTSVGINITSAISTIAESKLAGTGYFTTLQGAVYKVISNLTLNSGEAPYRWVILGDNTLLSSVQLTAGVNNYYYTDNIGGVNARDRVRNYVLTNFSCLWSHKQLLTPSATGVTIVNSKGGATYNWTSKDANFNYNDSSGYTYTIYSVPGYTGSGWFGDGVDDRIVHSSLNLGTTHTLHYWLLYQGISGVIHGGAANYHGLRLTPTACGYNVGTTEVTVTHSAAYGRPVLFSVDRNGTSVDFYQNGVKIGATQTLLANTAQVLTDFLRYSNGTSYWNGVLFDAVNINTNKGAQEIRNFFEMTRAKYGQ